MMKENLVCFWEGVRKSDRGSFKQLHSALYPALFVYVKKMVRDEDLADDLVQELFIKFWENRERIGPLQKVKEYFLKSARFTTLNYLRSAQKTEMKLRRLPRPDLQFSKEDVLIANETYSEISGLLHQALNRLPGKQREAVYLKFYEGLDYGQITEITGIRYQSVVNHVYRALRTLRETAAVKRIAVAG